MEDGQNSSAGGGERTKQASQRVRACRKTGRHTHTPGTEMDQEAVDPGIAEISDLDDQGGNGVVLGV